MGPTLAFCMRVKISWQEYLYLCTSVSCSCSKHPMHMGVPASPEATRVTWVRRGSFSYHKGIEWQRYNHLFPVPSHGHLFLAMDLTVNLYSKVTPWLLEVTPDSTLQKTIPTHFFLQRGAGVDPFEMILGQPRDPDRSKKDQNHQYPS